MILGIDKVVKLIKTKKLIEGLDEDNLNFEGCGVDLRIGEIYEMEQDEGFLHIETRKTPNFKLLAKYEKSKKARVKLKPGRVYSAMTIEKINTPQLFRFDPDVPFCGFSTIFLQIRSSQKTAAPKWGSLV